MKPLQVKNAEISYNGLDYKVSPDGHVFACQNNVWYQMSECETDFDKIKKAGMILLEWCAV